MSPETVDACVLEQRAEYHDEACDQENVDALQVRDLWQRSVLGWEILVLRWEILGREALAVDSTVVMVSTVVMPSDTRAGDASRLTGSTDKGVTGSVGHAVSGSRGHRVTWSADQ